MIKLICYDLDGTINDGWDLLPELKKKMTELKVDNVKQAIITGRDPLGTLFFVHRCMFPFDYLGTGGGGIIINPLNKLLTRDLFDETTRNTVINCSLSKAERLLYVQSLVGCKTEEILYIDDNMNKSADTKEISEKVYCLIASPYSNNLEWIEFVKLRKGYYTDKPCGLGTFEILNYYFKKD